MDDRQENTLSMYQVVGPVLDTHAGVWSGVPALVAARAAFLAEVTNIQNLTQSQQQPSTGVTTDKQHAREAMADAAMVVVGPLCAFAAVTGNADLAAQSAFTRSDFVYGRDNQAATNGDLVHALATAHATPLTDYGVTAGMLTALRAAIDAYRAIIQRPRQVITTTSAATAQLDGAFTRATQVLTERIDKLMELFRLSHPTFYNEYQAARNTIGPNGDSGDDPGEGPPTP